MEMLRWIGGVLMVFCVSAVALAAPRQWIDPATGHRIVRISVEPGTRSLYFHQNAYTPQGDLIVVNAPSGIQAINLKTWTVKTIVPGKFSALFVGHKSRTVYYTATPEGDAPPSGPLVIYAADIDTGATREIVRLPQGKIESINADDTLLLGTNTEGEFKLTTGPRDPRFDAHYEGERRPDGTPYSFAEAKERRLDARLEAHLPMELFTVDIATGTVRVIYRSTDWLNHLQFSPTDPGQIMFCHEGPWHKVDRIWTIRTDGTGLTLIHRRFMNMEIAGHEFFSPDGQQIFYDLETPRGVVFWLASYDLATGKRVWRHLNRDNASVHFNVSRDGSVFSGDGSDAQMVAHSKKSKWLFLFHSKPVSDVADIHAPGAADLVSAEVLTAERLVNMSRNDYRLEPNATFTPDGRWLIFRANFEGAAQVYAVEVAKARR